MALPNIIQQINSKLPLSGGTMTGSIRLTNASCVWLEDANYHYLCARPVNTSYTIITAGSNANNSGSVYLYGTEHSSYPGDVMFQASSADGTKKYCRFKPTGKLVVDGNDVITSAGGTMKNTITCSSSYTVAIQKENATSMLTLRSSNDWNGGCIHLWGGNNSGNYPGEVEIIPRTVDSDGTSHHTVFRFRKDGTIERGSTPIHFVVTSWSSGATWYRVWSNGLIEQGGSIPSGGASGWRTLTFPKSFSNTNYSIVVSCSDVNDISYWASSWTKTASTVKVGTGNYIGTKSFIGVDWYACGY